jgi:ATP-dependent protease Clp ATPase subunit
MEAAWGKQQGYATGFQAVSGTTVAAQQAATAFGGSTSSSGHSWRPWGSGLAVPTPRQIVEQLDKHVIGQAHAKKVLCEFGHLALQTWESRG